MNLYPIDTGTFRLDGGAMFGVVPKVIWERTNPADPRNQIEMAMRCLLVQDGERLALIENGIGHKYNDRFRELYAIDHSITLEQSLRKAGFGAADVTDLVLTHLHFDHCGGSTIYNPTKERYEMAFPNATIWLQRSHWELTQHPNAREKASFFKENIDPLMESGQLKLLDGEKEIFPGLSVKVVNGHTAGQQLPFIRTGKQQVLFSSDLFPTYGHIPLPYVMGYDTQPLVTLDEREQFLPWLADEEIILFYYHDPYHECGKVVRTEKGGYKSGDTFPLKDIAG